MDRVLRGIIIGSGHFAQIQMEAWASVQGASMVAIVSQKIAQATQLAKQYGIVAFENWDEAISAINPDFIDVCTPPDSHYHYVKLSADLGLPVLCQKPLAPTWEQSKAMVQYCMDKNVPFMVNENWRWQGWFREMKQMMKKGMLGDVYTAYFAMRPGDGWGDSPYPVQPYFKDMKKFLLYETGVHWIDTFRYLFGEIASVYCQTRTINRVIQGEDLAIVHFNFDNGMVGIYDANRTTYMEQVRTPAYGWMTVEGSEGKLRLEMAGRIYYTPRDGREQEHIYPIPPGWKGGSAIATQQHFIDGLLHAIPFETEGTEYLKTIAWVYACYRSASHNTVVTEEQLLER